jgi:peptide methionine sulfoxide reductase MsrA
MTETAVFGGGCFWCIEAVFNRMAGVESAESGYMGGTVENPTYQQVCTVFFTVHDPTTLNRQGNDSGTQYRSVIFYDSEEQRRQAEQAIGELNAAQEYPDPVVTAVEPATTFYKAEGYHQEYYTRNAGQPYCRMVIAPKLKKFQQAFGAKQKSA